MQPSHQPHDGKGNGRSACDRCRRHKLRCERSSDSAQCRRCSKANVACVTGTALKSGRPPQRRQPSDAPEIWSLHQTLQTPTAIPDTDPGIGREMQLPLSSVNIAGFENGWPGSMQQDIGAPQAFQPLVNTYQPLYSHVIHHNDCLKRLGDLQTEILADLELAKACKTATDCPQLALTTDLEYNSSFLVGRMLEHSKTLLGILDSFGSMPAAPTCFSDADCLAAGGTPTGSLHCDVPTTFSLFSSYICLIRIYRVIFSCIHDSMPALLGLQQPLPQLFPGINLAGFSLETRLDLQVQILVQVSEDMLAKLEARFGIGEGTAPNQGIFEPTRAGKMLSMMLEEEANEQPPLYEPRSPCEPLKNILANLKRMINAETSKSKDF